MGIKQAISKISNATWVIIGIALTFTLGLMWFVKTFDKVAFERHLGYSQEARRNPYLAAELFLKQRNTPLETRQDFNIFDDAVGQFDTVLISGSRIGMATSHRQKMRRWVEQGGHLVVLATEFYEYDFNASRDKFLDELGLRYYPNSEEDYGYDEDEEEDLARLTFAGFDEESKVRFYPDGYLDDTSGEATFTAGTADNDQLVQYTLGEGLLTVLVDFSIWNNYRIDQLDHAMLLSQLIGNSPRAWLVYNRLQPSLFSLMVQHLPLVLTSAGLLSIFLLFGALWRKGPARDDTPPVQREIMQHIAAAGEFAFRADSGQQLLLSLRQSIDQRLRQLVPGFQRLPADKQRLKLSQITGIAVERLSLLPQSDMSQSESQSNLNRLDETSLDPRVVNQDTFVATVQLIQDIRKHL